MSFFNFIEKLQKKPEASRKKIVFISVFAIMAVIVAVWLTTFNLKTEEIKKAGEPFDFIKEGVKNFYGFIQNSVK